MDSINYDEFESLIVFQQDGVPPPYFMPIKNWFSRFFLLGLLQIESCCYAFCDNMRQALSQKDSKTSEMSSKIDCFAVRRIKENMLNIYPSNCFINEINNIQVKIEWCRFMQLKLTLSYYKRFN